jgi:hypothetical protein
MTIHFQTKTHLLMWTESNCPRKAIVRAMQEGQVELLGGFSKIPPTTHPGWIIRVTSVSGKKWNVVVIAYQNRYGIRILSEIPWQYWIGDKQSGALHQGDNPDKCKFMRDLG